MKSNAAKLPGPGRYLPGTVACLIISSCFWANHFSLAEDLPSLDVIAGKALFEKNWVSAPASTAASDGLGPFFNARSCAACHPGGGRGGSIESLSFVSNHRVYGKFLQTHAIQGLRAEGQVDAGFSTEIARLADGSEVIMHVPQYELYDLQYGVLSPLPSARVAPSLRGLGLFEQVPEHYLRSLADPDDLNGDGISGRISKIREAGSDVLIIGRFGWKAETGSLEMQAAKALSLDMGLGTSLFPSAFGDCTSSQADCLRQVSGNSPDSADPEVSDTILKLLLTYLQSLVPAPHLQEQPRHESAAAGILEDGLAVFEKTGCSACHLPSIPAGTSRISAYTDLLLHEMGPALAAESTDAASATEWRTAPLWGLSSVRSYLHDGRATTLAEAIVWHGGEATSAVKAYSRLPAAEREVLHTWLHGL